VVASMVKEYGPLVLCGGRVILLTASAWGVLGDVDHAIAP
jgi:hypothetical protein